MNKQRLEQMVTMLRALPPEKHSNFDLSAWSCGTSACAVGYACLNPVFVEQGLTRTVWGAPVFKRFTSWDAVEIFFDLSFEKANYLFSVDDYQEAEKTTPNQVADRIVEFIESDGDSFVTRVPT